MGYGYRGMKDRLQNALQELELAPAEQTRVETMVMAATSCAIKEYDERLKAGGRAFQLERNQSRLYRTIGLTIPDRNGQLVLPVPVRRVAVRHN